MYLALTDGKQLHCRSNGRMMLTANGYRLTANAFTLPSNVLTFTTNG